MRRSVSIVVIAALTLVVAVACENLLGDGDPADRLIDAGPMVISDYEMAGDYDEPQFVGMHFRDDMTMNSITWVEADGNFYYLGSSWLEWTITGDDTVEFVVDPEIEEHAGDIPTELGTVDSILDSFPERPVEVVGVYPTDAPE